jgi:hypothetical protein
MSGQPPGYNPGESLLQGGNASITPMQGGGTTDPEVSLLQGGNTANIIPLKGGRRTLRARPKGANTTPKQRIEFPTVATVVFSLPPEISKAVGKKKKGGLKKKSLVGGAPTDPISVETRKLEDAEGFLEDMKGELAALKDKYVPEAMKWWERYDTKDTKVKTPGKFITLDKYIAPKGAVDAQKGEGGFDRLAIILREHINRIVIFPSVRGNPLILKRCLKTAAKYEKDDTAILLFSPGFFGTDTPTNVNLLANFLKFKMDAQADVYLLSENTAATKAAGNAIQALDDPKVGVPIMNMLEPSYIVYPFSRTIEGELRGGILFSAATADELDLPASNITSIPGVADYIRTTGRGPMAFPPNLKAADKLGKASPYEVYRFTGPNTMVINSNEFIRIKLKASDNEFERESTMESEDKFQATENDHLVMDRIDRVEIRIGDQPYNIRKPDNTGDVIRNWENLKFTKDEAAVLNILNLRPSMLAKIFTEVRWQNKLADFLEDLVNSKCFVTTDLLTHGECNRVSEFVNRVAEYYLTHDQRLVAQKEAEDLAAAEHADDTMMAAFDERETAEEAAAAAKKQQAAEMERIREFAAALGVDSTISAEALSKDPFVDGRLKKVEKSETVVDSEISRKIGTDIWEMEIYAIKRGGSDIYIGEISAEAEDEEAAFKAMDPLLIALEKDYPGWFFKG